MATGDKLVKLDGLKAVYDKQNGNVAPTEASATASAAHAAGSYFIMGGVLYRATADIDIGDTITAGTNCQTVPNGLSGEVSDLTSNFGTVNLAQFCPVTWTPTITNGEYIKLSDGSKGTWNKAARTGLWNGYGSRIAINLTNTAYKYAVFYYDATGSISSGTGYLGNSGYYTGVRYIPKKAIQFALTFQRVDGENMTDADVTAILAALSAYAPTDRGLTVQGAAADAKTVGIAISDLHNSIDTLKSIVALDTVYLPFAIAETGKYITSAGGVNSNSTTNITDYVDVRGVSKIVYKCTGVTESSTAWYTAFYDGNYNVVGTPSRNAYSQSTRGYIEREKTVPSGAAYARFTVFADTTTYGDFAVWMASYPLKTAITALDQKITDEVSFNACMAMYDSFGVCGASWDCAYYIVDGTSQRIPKLAWGSVVARRNGNTCGIYAYQGLTTKTWLSSNYGLPAMLAASPHDLYICTFGGNDSAEGETWLGSITDITSHESPEEYGDTFFGNYGRIIEQIKSHAPNAQIIIVMNYDASRHSESRENYYNATVEIAEHYGLPHMNWAEDPWYNSDFRINASVSDHPTAPIYSGIALAWERLYSKCVRQFYNYFKGYLPQS